MNEAITVDDLRAGIYTRKEFDYDSIPALNQSALKPIATSPLHCRAALDAGEAPAEKPHMRLGLVAHTATLEPARLDQEYVAYVPPPGKSDRFDGKAYDAFCEEHAPRKVIKRKEREEAVLIAAEVRRHEKARRYLERGVPEAILIWHEPKFGVWCKARLDWISLSVRDVMCELKTSNSIAPRVFSSRFASYGYDVQAAFYCRGYQAITGRPLYAKCIAVESGPPHDVIVYDLAEAIDVGGEYVDEYLAKYAECVRTGEWPGMFPDTEVALQLPQWRRPGEDDDLSDLGLVIGGEP